MGILSSVYALLYFVKYYILYTMKYIHTQEQDICPVARVAELLGDRCTLLIVRDLLNGPQRFKDFEKSFGDISSRTITNKLKILLEHNIISRVEFKEKPPRVVYELTRDGKRLAGLIDELRLYGKKYLKT